MGDIFSDPELTCAVFHKGFGGFICIAASPEIFLDDPAEFTDGAVFKKFYAYRSDMSAVKQDRCVKICGLFFFPLYLTFAQVFHDFFFAVTGQKAHHFCIFRIGRINDGGVIMLCSIRLQCKPFCFYQHSLAP